MISGGPRRSPSSHLGTMFASSQITEGLTIQSLSLLSVILLSKVNDVNRLFATVFQGFFERIALPIGWRSSNPFRSSSADTPIRPGEQTELSIKFNGSPSISTAHSPRFNFLRKQRHLSTTPEFTGLGGELDRLRGYARTRISLWAGDTSTEEDCYGCHA